MFSSLAGLPIPMALAAVALVGYVVGTWRRRKVEFNRTSARRELRRAKSIVRSLESIADDLRANLSTHHASVRQFRARVNQLAVNQDMADWQELSEEADKFLRPTMRLATHVAQSYDELRQQMNMLMTFTEIRTDPLTGLSNRRALDDSIGTLFAMKTRYGNDFSLIAMDIDHFKQVNDEQGHLFGDQILQRTARLLDSCARDTDIVVRYGGEEFVILLPETDLHGAAVFAERLRIEVEQDLPVTVSCGAAAVLDGDNAKSIFARADEALYAAKRAGRNRAFRHSGEAIEPAYPQGDDAPRAAPIDPMPGSLSSGFDTPASM